MKFNMVLGTELDLTTPGELRESEERVVGSVRDMLSGASRKPTYVVRREAASFPTGTGALVLELGSPPSGKMWQLMRVTLLISISTGYLSINDGTDVLVFVGGSAPRQLTASTISFFPTIGFVGTVDPARSMLEFSVTHPVYQSDELFVVFDVATTYGQDVNVVAAATMAEFDDTSQLRGAS